MKQVSAIMYEERTLIKRALFLFAPLALLGWVWMQTPQTSGLLTEFSRFLLLGIMGAIFANSTGAGGGVIFIPAFDMLGLTASQSVSTSFAIQCFGMTAGSLSWLYHYHKNHLDDPLWAPLPRLLLVCSSAAVIGIWLTYTAGLQAPGALHFTFSWFSIILGCTIILLALTRKNLEFQSNLGAFDFGVLFVLCLLGGVITAWLSVGVGELTVIYLLLRKCSPSMAIAAGVMISAITVWSASPLHLSSDSDTLFAIVLFAGPGAILGGILARKLAIIMSVAGLKLFFASWIVLTGVFTLLRHS